MVLLVLSVLPAPVDATEKLVPPVPPVPPAPQDPRPEASLPTRLRTRASAISSWRPPSAP